MISAMSLRPGVRKLWFKDMQQATGSSDPHGGSEPDRRVVETLAEATMIGAESFVSGSYYPTLDIDFPCQLQESETPGHHHLLIDKAMTWEQYVVLLQALNYAGIIEDGYLSASLARKDTFVALKPWKKT